MEAFTTHGGPMVTKSKMTAERWIWRRQTRGFTTRRTLGNPERWGTRNAERRFEGAQGLMARLRGWTTARKTRRLRTLGRKWSNGGGRIVVGVLRVKRRERKRLPSSRDDAVGRGARASKGGGPWAPLFFCRIVSIDHFEGDTMEELLRSIISVRRVKAKLRGLRSSWCRRAFGFGGGEVLAETSCLHELAMALPNAAVCKDGSPSRRVSRSVVSMAGKDYRGRSPRRGIKSRVSFSLTYTAALGWAVEFRRGTIGLDALLVCSS
ncbi:hypothetical protein LZ30DRAFT_81381 [Colletotrichum cereale]|nr:hypothetical protein LZ30DRAFT_81381 [Colletotrichum cereale]